MAFWGSKVMEIVKKHDSGGLVWKKRLLRVWQGTHARAGLFSSSNGFSHVSSHDSSLDLVHWRTFTAFSGRLDYKGSSHQHGNAASVTSSVPISRNLENLNLGATRIYSSSIFPPPNNNDNNQRSIFPPPNNNDNNQRSIFPPPNNNDNNQRSIFPPPQNKDVQTGRSLRPMGHVRGILDDNKNLNSSRFGGVEQNADIVHIKLIRNNTFVTVTDSKGNKKIGASSGCLQEMKGGPKNSRYAAEATAEHVGRLSRNLGLKSVVMKVNGFTHFKKKKQAILNWREGYTYSRGDLNPVVYCEDTTRRAHNGCRLPKKRRV